MQSTVCRVKKMCNSGSASRSLPFVVVTLHKSLFARAWRMHRRQQFCLRCLGVQQQHMQGRYH